MAMDEQLDKYSNSYSESGKMLSNIRNKHVDSKKMKKS